MWDIKNNHFTGNMGFAILKNSRMVDQYLKTAKVQIKHSNDKLILQI